LRYFIITTRKLSKIDRQEIDKGKMKREAITVVNCIRSSLFTSYGLRKNVNVVIYPLDPGNTLIRIEGDKLRYMGPDERSISVLLSIPAEKLLHETFKKPEVTSPGITLVDGTPASIIRYVKNPLILYQHPNGHDVRKIRFSDGTVFFGSLDPRMDPEENIILSTKGVKLPIGVTSIQCEKMILLLNNEIDRKLGENLQHL
jgi:tRNA pseudouridine-54 N-methylase